MLLHEIRRLCPVGNVPCWKRLTCALDASHVAPVGLALWMPLIPLAVHREYGSISMPQGHAPCRNHSGHYAC